jgi:hypothetical protein
MTGHHAGALYDCIATPGRVRQAAAIIRQPSGTSGTAVGETYFDDSAAIASRQAGVTGRPRVVLQQAIQTMLPGPSTPQTSRRSGLTSRWHLQCAHSLRRHCACPVRPPRASLRRLSMGGLAARSCLTGATPPLLLSSNAAPEEHRPCGAPPLLAVSSRHDAVRRHLQPSCLWELGAPSASGYAGAHTCVYTT